MNADAGVDTETLEIELFLEAVARRYGYDFREYAPASLRRRIRWTMQQEGLDSISQLQDLVLHRHGALQRLIGRLSVHVTGMFRDPAFYRALREEVVPVLKTYAFTRIWHAGCSSGEEVYSLAIVLQEEGIYDRCRIYATDISETLLQRAKRGIFPLQSMRGHTERYQQAGGRKDFSRYYTTDPEHAVLARDLRHNVLFSQHNLASDGSFNTFHLILCRNVLIYFGQPLRDRVHQLLYESLVRRGYLALGMRENIRYSPRADGYAAVDESVRLYRRKR